VQAKSVLLRWFGKINYTDLTYGKLGNDIGTGEIVDENNLLWETDLIDTILGYPLPDGVKIYFRAARR